MLWNQKFAEAAHAQPRDCKWADREMGGLRRIITTTKHPQSARKKLDGMQQSTRPYTAHGKRGNGKRGTVHGKRGTAPAQARLGPGGRTAGVSGDRPDLSIRFHSAPTDGPGHIPSPQVCLLQCLHLAARQCTLWK